MSDLDRFRSALRQALGEAFLHAGRHLTPEARRDFSERALAIVAAELGEPPGEELRKAIQEWSWKLYLSPRNPRRRTGARRASAVHHPSVSSVEVHDACTVYRLRSG